MMTRLCLVLLLIFVSCKSSDDVTIGKSDSEDVTFDKFIGVCSFMDVPTDLESPFGVVRDYFNLRWVTEKTPVDINDVKFEFNPSYSFGGGWNFDEPYRKRKEAGISTVLTIKETLRFLDSYGASGSNNGENQPIDNGYTFADSENPEAYYTYARGCFQVAARYGSTVVSEDRLHLTSDQQKLSGLDYVEYIELWNEPNKWWQNEYSEFTPAEFAAFLSACIDGHKGTMKDAGVLQADPKMKVLTGGIVKMDVSFLDETFKKMAEIRNQSVKEVTSLFYGVGIHRYSNNGDENGVGRTMGISPEEDNMETRIHDLVEWASQYPGLKISVGEFGYDTTPTNSKQYAPKLYDLNNEETQAAWILRNYFAMAAGGASSAKMYILRDPGSTGTYATCGVTKPKGNYAKKTSWYAVATAKNVLKGCKYVEKIDNGYKFEDTQTGKTILVIWNDTDWMDYTVSGEFDNIFEIRIAKGSETGETTELDNSNPVIKDVGNMPVFVEYYE